MLPVTDVSRSREWYESVLGVHTILDEETEEGVVEVTLEHPAGILLYLRSDPDRAAALRGFGVLSLDVGTRDELDRWAGRLDALGVTHGTPREAHLGWVMGVEDPDGMLVSLHTSEEVSSDDG